MSSAVYECAQRYTEAPLSRAKKGTIKQTGEVREGYSTRPKRTVENKRRATEQASNQPTNQPPFPTKKVYGNPFPLKALHILPHGVDNIENDILAR